MAIPTVEKDGLSRGWSIDELWKTARRLPLLFGRGRVSPEEILFFLDQLSLMLETGTPLNKSIRAIVLQIKNSRFRNILEDIERDIEEGRLLSSGMAKYPEVFSPIYVSMIRAGESGGFLKDMLHRIVMLEERHQEFVSTIRAALYYPAFLSLFATSVVIFIVVVIFPRFGEMFTEIYDSLPITTKILMGASHILTSYWYLIILFIPLGWFVTYKAILSEKGRMYIDVIKLKFPLFNNFFAKLYVSRLMRTLGSLLNSNVPILESLSICSGAMGNKVFVDLVENIRASVEGGKPLSSPIMESPYFPETVRQMIRTGEETGTLDRVMPRLADYYDEDIKRHVKKVTAVLEPVLLLFVGGVIGIVVISLILPIFKLTRTIH